MNGLAYLGSGIGPASMPAAVPGAGHPSPMMPGLPPGAVGPSPMQSMPPGAIPGMPSPFMSPPQGPPEYKAVTQADGSILLHIQNPDGSLGPAVKIINPIKPNKPQGQPTQ